MNHGRRTGLILICAVQAVLLLVSCKPGGIDRKKVVARIEVSPGSLLFASGSRDATLVAKAFNADGEAIDTVFVWTSSKPAQITVDDTGHVSAVTDIGSAVVVAQAQDAHSSGVLVAAVDLKPGGVLVSDDQVVEVGPPFQPPGALPDDPRRVQVRLRQVPVPQLGTVMVASESAAIAGVVESATQEGTDIVVQLRIVPVPQLFDRYDFDWGFDLADDEIVMDEPASETTPTPLLPAVTSRPSQLESTIEKKFPPGGSAPFSCTASASAYISKSFVSLSLTGDAKLVYRSNKGDAALPPEYLKIAVEGPLALKGTIGIKAEAGFKASAKCELKGRIPIPILGWFSGIVSPALPIGIGVLLDGKLVVASLELGLEGRNGVDLSVGVECGSSGCSFLSKFDPINELTPKVTVPSDKNMRVDLSASAYILTGLDLVVLSGLYNVEVARVTYGPAQEVSLAFSDAQAEDRGYASSYALSLKGKLEPGSDVSRVVKALMDQDVGQLGAEINLPPVKLAHSPEGVMTTDKAVTSPNEKVHFTFNLTDTHYGIVGYNVESVKLYKKKEGETTYTFVDTIPVAASEQASFAYDWTPKNEDIGKFEFFAFTKTKMPVIELETGADSSRKVEVQAICIPSSKRGAPNVVASNGVSCTGTGTLRHTINDPDTGLATETTANITLTEDPSLEGGGILAFRPSGTFAFSGGGALTGTACTQTIALQTGAITPTDGALLVFIDGVVYPKGQYMGQINAQTLAMHKILNCPGDPPQTLDYGTEDHVFDVDPTQGFITAPDGKSLTGSYSANGETWEWNLTIQPSSQ